MIGFIGGLAGLGNYMKQRNDEREARAEREEDRAYRREQRDEWRRSRDRTIADQQRADRARDETSRLASEGQEIEVDAEPAVEAQPPAATLPVDTRPTPTQIEAAAAAGVEQPGPPAAAAPTRKIRIPQTRDAFLREKAKILDANGFSEEADKVRTQAEHFAFQRSAAEFSRIQSAAAGKTSAQVATELAKVFNRDPMPGKITKIEDTGGGSSRLTFTISTTGQTLTKDVKDTADLLQGMEAYYSPQTFAAAQAAKRDALIKLQAKAEEEGLKRHSVAPGATLTDASGKVLYHNPKLEKGDGSGSGSSGSGHGGPGAGAGTQSVDDMLLAGFEPKDAQKQAAETVDRAAADMGEQLTPQERAKRINEAFFALRNDYRSQMQRDIVARKIPEILRAASADPKRYATEYQSAVKWGISPQALASQGFMPPAGLQVAPPAAPATQVAPAAPAARVVPAAPVDPLNGLSVSQARAKRAELVAEIQRWASNPSAAQRVAELKELVDRIDTNRF